MRRLIRICFAGVLIALMSDCGPKPQVQSGYTDAVPREIRDLIRTQYRESVHAVGIAVGPTEALALNKATMQARAEIARQFRSAIDVLQKEFEETVNRESREEYQQVMQIFAGLEISGSQVVKELVRSGRTPGYEAKVLVVVSASRMKAIIDEQIDSYTSFRASKAYQELEERVRREQELLRSSPREQPSR